MGRIDDGLSIGAKPDVIFAAFGDMMRVPGTHGSPLEHKARGMDVRIVYSPSDAIKLAKMNPEKHVMFFAIGFETTAPSTALTLQRAKKEGLPNFSVFCNHVTIIPAIRAILDSPDMRLDGFIGPGHVSTVIGCRPYEWIAKNENKPIVVAGFEPLDLLQSIVMLLRQLRAGEAKVENQYKRVVPWEGNRAALQAMADVFQLRPYFEWRGLGFISQSALRLREEYAEWDAERRFEVPGIRVTDPKAAQCGEVLKGVLKPAQCKLFGNECTPEHPVGALMVSSEGSCAAYYSYEHRKAALTTLSASV
jgi:hydrogenase expression/formation protein HypD